MAYVPGEGWYYENYGETGKWQRPRAKEQLEVAEQAFAKKDYPTDAPRGAPHSARMAAVGLRAARGVSGRAVAWKQKARDEAAFNAYQQIIKKYPKSGQYNEVLWRQYEIANRFLGGEWFRLWNIIPLYPSMDETAKLYSKIVDNGPYSEVAPHAQLRIGAAREKQKNYADAVGAYTTAADRYHDQPEIAADAMYRAGVAWEKQADTAEYDQGAAAQAIAAYTDFIAFYPDDKRVADAQKAIVKLKAEQVRGSFEIAQFYENGHKWAGAVVYYNDVLQLDANSPLAAQARQRIDLLKPRLQAPAEK